MCRHHCRLLKRLPRMRYNSLQYYCKVHAMAYFTFTQRGSFSALFADLYYVCRQVDPNNGGPASTLVTAPKQYEVVFTPNGINAGLFTRVLDFEPSKLSRTEKYATTSYNFATVEFYVGGYYLGHSFINKTFQRTVPENQGNSYTLGISDGGTPAPVALALVTANGFLPSLHILDSQPSNPNDPNPSRIDLVWALYYIIPAPSVKLEILFP